MIFDQFKNLTRERTIKATIGMSREKFGSLVDVFANSYNAIQQERLKNKEIKRIKNSGPTGILDTPEKQLFFVLYYLKTYPTFDVLGFHFDLSAGHAHDYVVCYLSVLQHSLETLGAAPKREISDPKEFMQLIEKYDKILIDGTEASCVRPADNDEQENRYSGKKKRHTVKSLVISTQDKNIVYISSVYGGCTHDYTMMKECFPTSESWFDKIDALADLGFLGASKDYSASISLPHKKPRKSKSNPSPQLTDIQKQENRAHSKIRVAVENAIGGMKHFYCLTHRIRNHSTELIDQFFGLSAGLWNFKTS